jgi:tRNA-specific 2-thiouridylase
VLEEHLGPEAPSLRPGPLRLQDGTVVGEHGGFARYTIGQRKGLPGGFAEPMFVVAIHPEERAVVIGPRDALLGRAVEARSINWLADAPAVGDAVQVQLRHRARATAATVVEAAADRLRLTLDEPVMAVAPGQSVVVFDGPVVLGGGVIEHGEDPSPVPGAYARGGQRRAGLPILAT